MIPLPEDPSLRFLWLCVRHRRAPESSYWWLDGSFAESPSIRPVRDRVAFESPHEIEEIWQWVLDTSAARGLAPPQIDEQIWALVEPTARTADLDAAMNFAVDRLGASPLSLRLSSTPPELGSPAGEYHLEATFPSRLHSVQSIHATFFRGELSATQAARFDCWARRLSERLSIPYHSS